MEIVDVKNKLIDALGAADLDSMSLNDLGIYVQILRAATEIPAEDSMTALLETITKIREEFDKCHCMSANQSVGIVMAQEADGE